jgi:hypothetical protein
MPMNTEHFINLAGIPAHQDPSFAAMVKPSKLYPGLWESESLCKWQSHVFNRGFTGAQLSQNIRGWCVINDSGLSGRARMSDNFDSMFDAIKWGIAWAKEDPTRREFYAYKKDLLKDPNAKWPNG